MLMARPMRSTWCSTRKTWKRWVSEVDARLDHANQLYEKNTLRAEQAEQRRVRAEQARREEAHADLAERAAKLGVPETPGT
jgi:hypothetical protein